MIRRPYALAAALALLLGLLSGCGGEPQKELFLPEAENDFVIGWVGGGSSSQPEASEETFAPSSLPQATSSLPQLAGQAPVASVEAHFTQDSYPVGTSQLTLVVANRGESTLEYTSWFDFRQVTAEGLLPLTPREGAMVNPAVLRDIREPQQSSLLYAQSLDPAAVQRLAPGETAETPVPIDLFDPPLGPGTYRAAQLACFADPQGQALACTEIAAEFTLTAKGS